MTRRRAHSHGGGDSSADRHRPPIVGLDTWARDILALYSAVTVEQFVGEAFRAVRRVVACEYVSVFYKRAGDCFLKERDSRGRTWNRAFMRRYEQLTPAIPLVAANPGIKILATRFVLPASDEELHTTAFFQEIMRPQGWRHGAVLCFWAAPVGSFPVLVLTLYRTPGRPDFTHRELALLEHLHAFLAPAVTRFHQVSATTAVADGMAMALRRGSRSVVVLDWQLRVAHMNVAARHWCAQWNKLPAADPARLLKSEPSVVPACLLLACRELREELASAMRQDGDRTTKCGRLVVCPEWPTRTAFVTVMCQAAVIAEPSFVIEFHRTSDGPVHDDAAAEMLMRLTPSERDVARVVSEGLSNEEAAERLGKTVHAVKFLLHRTYRKLEVPNRAKLSLLLAGRTESTIHHATKLSGSRQERRRRLRRPQAKRVAG